MSAAIRAMKFSLADYVEQRFNAYRRRLQVGDRTASALVLAEVTLLGGLCPKLRALLLEMTAEDVLDAEAAAHGDVVARSVRPRLHERRRLQNDVVEGRLVVDVAPRGGIGASVSHRLRVWAHPRFSGFRHHCSNAAQSSRRCHQRAIWMSVSSSAGRP